MSLDFHGKVALITGAGNGLGKAYALELAAAGAQVVINDIGTDTRGEGTGTPVAESVAEEIRASGGQASAVTASVATTEGAEAMVAHAIDTFAHLDIVINNAGTVPNGQGVDEVSDDEWSRMLDVNLLGGIKVLRAAWPHLKKSPAGRVLNTSSSTVLGLPGALTYATAKAAMIGLTKNIALATQGTTIKINAIWPFGSSRMSSTDFADMFEEQYDLEPGEFNRTCTAEAVAKAVAALCHEDVPANGEVFAMGGGRLSRIFFGATRGVTAQSAEDYLREWDQVVDPSQFAIPAHALDAEQANISTDRLTWLDAH